MSYEETKRCPKCGSPALVRLSSLKTKKCGDCSHELHWPLKPGQLPLVTNNRNIKGTGNAES